MSLRSEARELNELGLKYEKESKKILARIYVFLVFGVTAVFFSPYIVNRLDLLLTLDITNETVSNLKATLILDKSKVYESLEDILILDYADNESTIEKLDKSSRFDGILTLSKFGIEVCRQGDFLCNRLVSLYMDGAIFDFAVAPDGAIIFSTASGSIFRVAKEKEVSRVFLPSSYQGGEEWKSSFAEHSSRNNHSLFSDLAYSWLGRNHGKGFSRILFLGENLGVMLDFNGRLFKTDDGGKSWELTTITLNGNIRIAGGSYFYTEEHGAVGELYLYEEKGEVTLVRDFKMDDESLSLLYSAGNPDIDSFISMPNSDTYSVVVDGGDIYTMQFTQEAMQCIVFRERSDSGEVCYEFPDIQWSEVLFLKKNFYGDILAINTAGSAIKYKFNPEFTAIPDVEGIGSSNGVSELFFSDRSLGFFLDLDGVLFYTTNGGENWDQYGDSLNKPFYVSSLRCFSDKSCYFLNEEKIYRFVDIRNDKLLMLDVNETLISNLTESSFVDESEKLKLLASLLSQVETFLRTDFKGLQSSTTKSIEKAGVRVALLGVIIYLMQILIGNYRYKVKISNLYFSRAKAIKIYLSFDESDENKVKLDTLISLMIPTVEFGSQPQAPIESIASVAGKIGPVNRGG